MCQVSIGLTKLTPDPIEKRLEIVHFCGLKRARSDRMARIAGLRYNKVLGGAFVLALVAYVALQSLGTPRFKAYIALAVGAFLGPVIVAFRSIPELRKLKRVGCDAATHASRLLCVGSPQDFERHGPIEDVPFQPELMRAPLVSGKIAAYWTTVILTAIAVLVLGVAFAPGAGLAPLQGFSYFFMVLPATIALFALEWLSPTYLRIVPGRVDVMEFGVFLRGRARVTKYDLRTAKVVVDLRQLAVFIDDEEKNVRAELAIAFVRDRYRLAYYVLLAALSTHEPGPLPDDALVG